MSRTANDAQQIDNGDQQREGVLDEYAQEGEYESSSDYDDELFVDKKESLEDQGKLIYTAKIKSYKPSVDCKDSYSVVSCHCHSVCTFGCGHVVCIT